MSAYNTVYTFSQKIIIIFYTFLWNMIVDMPLGFFMICIFIGILGLVCHSDVLPFTIILNFIWWSICLSYYFWITWVRRKEGVCQISWSLSVVSLSQLLHFFSKNLFASTFTLSSNLICNLQWTSRCVAFDFLTVLPACLPAERKRCPSSSSRPILWSTW